jgi:hypothetical protein
MYTKIERPADRCEAAAVNYYISVLLKMDWSGFMLFPASGRVL